MAGAEDGGELVEVADGCHAWMAGEATWGMSNAGLVTGPESSLLVDTLFDLHLTRRMLDAMGRHTAEAPIGTVVNTHANGDHCYGNALLADTHILTSAATAAEMADVPPAMMAAMAELEGELGDTFRRFFGRFDFSGFELPPVDETFAGSHALQVGGLDVQLIEVGPAHTAGDTIAWIPDRRVVYTGDICFIGSTPIVWAGPFSNWIAALDRITDLGPDVVVPGHGPVTDVAGVAEVREYLVFVDREARRRHEAGLDVVAAARDIALGDFAGLADRGRVVANVDAVYRELDPAHDTMAVTDLFLEMARYEQGRARSPGIVD
jgi:glyoxylase-like metal-dependent hydrolase (beta-lactamase superfamily II)